MAARDFFKDIRLEKRYFRTRIYLVALLVLLCILILALRLFYLQVSSHDHYATLSQENRMKIVPVPPTRGLVYDRNMNLLAANKPSYQIRVTPVEVDDMEQVISQLGQLIDLEEHHLKKFYGDLKRKQSFESITLKVNLSEEEVARFSVNRHRFPGIEITAHASRYYPMAGVNAHALGYVGRINADEMQKLDRKDYSGTTYIGKVGVEKFYEQALHGTVGYQHIEINAQGRRLRVLGSIPPEPGQDVMLTLDAQLQEVALQALGERKGSVVAMEPETGEILAFVSTPTYDPNQFVSGISSKQYAQLRDDPDQPLFNRALSGLYPPGSTIKPMVALAGLHYGVTRADETMWAGPFYQLPGSQHKYRDWKKEGHGRVDMPKAIVQSSDVYFYTLAYKLGIDRIAEFLAQFNFGSRTGLDTWGEAKGILPSQEWKRKAHGQPWYPGETVITGIGQGYLLTTPLQLALATSVLATRGQGAQPKFLRKFLPASRPSEDGNDKNQVPVPHSVDIADSIYWDQIVEAMEDSVHEPNGTAYAMGKDAGYRIAGKTGTAQVFSLKKDGEYREYVEEEIDEKLRDHALFIAFAPADKPKIAIAVVVENGGGGGTAAAPVAKAVLDHYLLGNEYAQQDAS
ncbi:MAG: penicillin-binding protein 2 [Gammaproteobacteria bacterium]|nr:penicillin-binding protein 2 [Gammaproteobacteria bacterium]